VKQVYGTVGQTYAATRKPDPRIGARIQSAFAGMTMVLNVGAGTGSYEPETNTNNHITVAVEPSLTMIRQRPLTAAPAVCGVGEALPFADDSFDAVMALLTIHHRTDQRKGLQELRHVAAGRIIIVTFDADLSESFWLVRDYLPAIAAFDRRDFPRIKTYKDYLGDLTVHPVPIPHDCVDGFLCAYWKRPEEYLRADVRAGISSFSALPKQDVDRGISRLSNDLASGVWHEKNSDLAGAVDMDFGYRLLIADIV
jgi:SAM-dependent methyltransferase